MPAARDTLRIALAQINPHLGQIEANVARIRAARAEAARLGADLVVTPELSISGYPPEDLIRKPAFVADCEAAIAALAAETADGGPALVVGGPWRDGGGCTTRCSCSTAAASPRAAPSTSCPITACSTRSACSMPAPPPARCRSAASASA